MGLPAKRQPGGQADRHVRRLQVHRRASPVTARRRSFSDRPTMSYSRCGWLMSLPFTVLSLPFTVPSLSCRSPVAAL